MQQATGPLQGIRIVDMTSVLMGPFATQILADYGADVIKIESAEGDLLRLGGALRNPKMGSLYLQTNRNKRSVVLDAKSEQGRAALLALCAESEVFISNVRPAAMQRLGLTYEDIKAVNPSIVYVCLVGFGQDGPYKDRPAYDDLIQGISAVPSLIGRMQNGDPQYVPLTLADKVVGLSAAPAILAALLHKSRTGVGQHIEVPMFEVMSQFVLTDHLGGQSFEPPIGPPGYNRLLSPARRPYRTSDGFISALVYTDGHWRRFFDLIGRPEEFLAPTHSIEDLIDDPHLRSVNLLQTIDHPTEGKLRMIAPPIKFSATPASIYRYPPGLGEHTDQVLAELAQRAPATQSALAQVSSKAD